MTVQWKEVDGELRAVVREDHKEKVAAWCRQPGSQDAFLRCEIFECLYEGTRGPGKTDALLVDFAQHVSKGYGADWRGILFRQTFPQLRDLIAKSKKLYHNVFPEATYNEAKSTWTWPTGEQLIFSYMQRSEDYWNYHGHAYPWIGWEELTTWPDPSCYKVMMSCSRSTRAGMPRKYRATTNPYGPGHNWVKARWQLPVAPGALAGPVIRPAGEPARVAVHGELRENKILLHAEPDYIDKIRAAARNKSELAAWLEGSWDIIAGGMFDDIWAPRWHVLPNFPYQLIPRGWRLDRSYDHGQSKPFSIGWWAESNGEPLVWEGRMIGTVPGDLIRVAEWYGWTGEPNTGLRMLTTDIAKGIVDRERDWGLFGHVLRGPADSSIFDLFEPGKSVASDMAAQGVNWEPSDKGPGSRKQGWEQVRKRLKGALPNPIDGSREDPGLFVTERCEHFRRTVPVLPRSDKDLDDADTDAEDHVADEVRYRVRRKKTEVSTWNF